MLDDFQPVADTFRGAYLAIGNFDGVHEGHARLIQTLRDRARAANAPAIAVTFHPRPVDILRPGQAPPPLSWLERKCELLRHHGADEVCVFHTGRWLLELSAREFFDRVVLGQFEARGMVEGPTFGFGRDRGGDALILAQWCANAGLAFEIVAPTECDGALISTTRIRAALAAADVASAARWLGRPHRLRGRVVKGAGRGAPLGFPTANLADIDVLVPAHGVYAGLAHLQNPAINARAAIHIGPNATFGETRPSVEAHILDFHDSLYDRMIELSFVDFIRHTKKFDTVDSLLAQIHDDVNRARNGDIAN